MGLSEIARNIAVTAPGIWLMVSTQPKRFAAAMIVKMATLAINASEKAA